MLVSLNSLPPRARIWRGCASPRASLLSNALPTLLKPPGERPVTVTLRRMLEAPCKEVSKLLIDDWPAPWIADSDAGLAVTAVDFADVVPAAVTPLRPGALREMRVTKGPATGAVFRQRVDAVRPGSMLSYHDLPGFAYHGQPYNADFNGMSEQAAEAAGQAVMARLPRQYRCVVRLVPSFRDRTTVEWRVKLLPPKMEDVSGERAEEQAAKEAVREVRAILDAAARLLERKDGTRAN